MVAPARLLLDSAGDRLPSPSGVAMAIMELWGNERTTVNQLASLVQTDPALAGRLLKLANSAAMGHRAVVAISDAIVRVGMQAVGQLAVAFSLIDSHADGPCRGFDYPGYWSHCLLMAVLSRGLAQSTRLAPPEDLFACGLLSRIGVLAIATVYPNEYSDLLASGPQDLAVAEKECFGIDHGELSKELMHSYRVPRTLAEPASYHEHPDRSGFDPNSRPGKLAYLFHAAYRLASMTAESGPDRSRQAIVNTALWARLGLNEEAVADLFDRAVGEWQEWSTLLNLPVETAVSYERVSQGTPVAVSSAGEAAADSTALRVTMMSPPGTPLHLADRLRQLGALVEVCPDESAALRTAIQLRSQICIVPAEELRLCRQIRATQWGSSVYVLGVLDTPDDSLQIECFEAGVDALIRSEITSQELQARLLPARRLVNLEEAWRKDRRELRRIANELAVAHRHQEVLSLTDQLTELPNRRAAMHALNQAWSRSSRSETPVGVTMIDIDHFKDINDRFGHAAGDQVLRDVAATLQEAAREDETIARLGGEEFVLISATSGLRELIVAAERLRRRLESTIIETQGRSVKLTASIGLAEREAIHGNADMLLNDADRAMYAAKSGGRNRICYSQDGRIHPVRRA